MVGMLKVFGMIQFPMRYGGVEMCIRDRISTFALDFIHTDRSVFKIVDLDEVWSFLQVAQGKTLSMKLVQMCIRDSSISVWKSPWGNIRSSS